jgi:outer membrane protein assembly factor BamB
MRRLAKALAAVAVLLAGAITAVVIHRLQAGKDVRGSSSVEYVTTEERAAPLPPHIEWPEYGFESTRTRAVQLTLRPPYRRVWTYRAGSLVEFPPSIGFGRLYFSTNSGNLTAISMKTGKKAWKYESGRCVAASPALGTQQHGTVYAAFLNKPPCNAKRGTGEVVAFSAGFGKIRWRRTTGASETSPLLVGNSLYVGDWNGRVWALDARSGRTKWVSGSHGPIKGAIAYADGRLYVGSYDGHVYCLGAAHGRQIWKATAQSRLYGHARFYATPAVAYGRVYIGGTDGKVYSFGATSGKLRWSHSTGGYVYASPAVWNQEVLVGSYSKTFVALDAATGAVKWTFKTSAPISGSATVIGNVVYFATLGHRTKGTTYALNARTGKLLWTYPDGKYTPAVAVKDHFFLVGYARIYGMVPR